MVIAAFAPLFPRGDSTLQILTNGPPPRSAMLNRRSLFRQPVERRMWLCEALGRWKRFREGAGKLQVHLPAPPFRVNENVWLTQQKQPSRSVKTQGASRQ